MYDLTLKQIIRTVLWMLFDKRRASTMVQFIRIGRTNWAAHEAARHRRIWELANDHGELPGEICCERATGEFCYEHTPRRK